MIKPSNQLENISLSTPASTLIELIKQYSFIYQFLNYQSWYQQQVPNIKTSLQNYSALTLTAKSITQDTSQDSSNLLSERLAVAFRMVSGTKLDIEQTKTLTEQI